MHIRYRRSIVKRRFLLSMVSVILCSAGSAAAAGSSAFPWTVLPPLSNGSPTFTNTVDSGYGYWFNGPWENLPPGAVRVAGSSYALRQVVEKDGKAAIEILRNGKHYALYNNIGGYALSQDGRYLALKNAIALAGDTYQ
jgi:hypothetical protein